MNRCLDYFMVVLWTKFSGIARITHKQINDYRKCILCCKCSGYKIGIKIVDEYMRDSSLKPCQKIQ